MSDEPSNVLLKKIRSVIKGWVLSMGDLGCDVYVKEVCCDMCNASIGVLADHGSLGLSSKEGGMQDGGNEESKRHRKMVLVHPGPLTNICIPSCSRDNLIEGSGDNDLDYGANYLVEAIKKQVEDKAFIESYDGCKMITLVDGSRTKDVLAFIGNSVPFSPSVPQGFESHPLDKVEMLCRVSYGPSPQPNKVVPETQFVCIENIGHEEERVALEVNNNKDEV